MLKPIVFLIILIIIVNLCYNITYQENIKERLDTLNELTTNIRTIDINDTIYNDIIFLENVLKNKRIVLLGEQLHYDGTTFKAKSRLIRYLHEKLNYDVVLYEAGLHDMWYMNQQNNIDPKLGVYSFWWENKECESLWNYYNNCKNSDHPISLGGFDIQNTGQISDTIRSRNIKNYLTRNNIYTNTYPAFNKIINDISMDWLWEYKKIRKSFYDSIQINLTNILSRLEREKMEVDDELYYRYIKGININNELKWKYNPGDTKRMFVRDSLMAQNLIWLINDVFRSKKVIIWAANIHIYNDYSDSSLNFKPMGAYIKEKYGNNVYSLAFTSYARKDRNGYLYNVASNKSVEYLLHLNNNQFSFINLADTIDYSFLKTKIISTVNQTMNAKENWLKQFDGVFFINDISPIIIERQ